MKFNTGSKSKKVILGVMSGTSCDGLDLALCRFWGEFPDVEFEIISAQCFEYSAEWREKLQRAIHLSALDLSILENQWTRKVADDVATFLANETVQPELIGFHGHTIFHQPQNGFTLQIGSGATLSSLTGVDTVCDFRQQDVARGGQGAPLVPMGEKWLFKNYTGFMNLGGFSNVTKRIVSDEGIETMLAHDVCALNIVINRLCGELELPYDSEGEIAASGKVSIGLFESLNAIEYYKNESKGSLGLEWVEQFVLPILEYFRKSENLSAENLIATFTEHCAYLCAQRMHAGKFLISGGGTHNTHLLNRIKHFSKAEIEVPNKQLNDFKEAIIFAFLAGLRVANLPNTLPSVTGASKEGVNGAHYKA
jgi:anhydro-N-acetylmuramic acid kinase